MSETIRIGGSGEYPRKHEIDSFITQQEAKEVFLSIMDRDREIRALQEQVEKLENKQQMFLDKLLKNGWHYFKANAKLFCIRELEPDGEFYLTSEVLLDLDKDSK